MKLYLASSLSNANDARAIAELLKREEAPRNMKFRKTPTKVVDSCGDDDEYEDI